MGSSNQPVGVLDGLVDRVEQSDALGALGDAAHPAVSRAVGGGWRLDLLTGRWLGHPAHPMVVIVPLGCWTAATVLDVSGLRSGRDAARRLVGLGVVAALPAVATGLADWRDTADAERRVGVAHAIGNQIAVAGFAGSWLARRRGAHGAGALISLVATTFATAAGFLGGHLAYRRGVGVNTTAFEAGPSEWTSVANVADIPLGEPTAVRAGDVVLMVRRGDDGVVVLEDRCTHRGGPLHEGQIDGDCVVCPWHASAFDLVTGAVRRGPASVPQPTYDVRVVAGQIEVRRHEAGALRANTIGPTSLDQPA